MLALPLLVAFWAAYGLAQSNLNQLNQGVNVTGMNLSGLPRCAQDCLGDSASEKAQGGCSAIDIKCLCSNTQYINVLACCLDTKCSADDQKKAVDFNSGLCKRVNITIPNFLGCSPGSNPFSNSTAPANVKGGSTSTNGNSGLPTGAKAGIGAGVGVVGLAAIAALLAFLAYRKRKHDEVTRFSSMQYQPSFVGPVDLKRGSMATTAPPYGPPYGGPPYAPEPHQQISELPSPLPTAPLPARPEDRPPLSQSELWFPGTTMAAAAAATSGTAPGMHQAEQQQQQQPPVEMPGDTDINQHHPAIISPIGPKEQQQQHSMMSPVSPEEPNRAATNFEAASVTPFLREGDQGQEGQGHTVGRVKSSVNLIEEANRGNEPGREDSAF